MGSLAHHSAVSLVHVHTQSQKFSKTSSNLPTEQEYMKQSSHVCTLVKISPVGVETTTQYLELGHWTHH
jgi:hypothetical protein